MAVEPPVHDQTSFQVDGVAGPEIPQVGLFQGFFDGGDPVQAVFDLFHGQTGPVMGNALIGPEFAR